MRFRLRLAWLLLLTTLGFVLLVGGLLTTVADVEVEYHGRWASRAVNTTGGLLFFYDSRYFEASDELQAWHENREQPSYAPLEPSFRFHTGRQLPNPAKEDALGFEVTASWRAFDASHTNRLELEQYRRLMDVIERRLGRPTLSTPTTYVQSSVVMPGVLPGLIVLLWPSACGIAWWHDRRRRRAMQDRCIACGYDVRATPDDGDCPECGRRINETPPPARRRRALAGLIVLLIAGWLGLALAGSLTDPIAPNITLYASQSPLAIELPPTHGGGGIMLRRGATMLHVSPAGAPLVGEVLAKASVFGGSVDGPLSWIDFGVYQRPRPAVIPAEVPFTRGLAVRLPTLGVLAALVAVAAWLILRQPQPRRAA